MDTHELTEERMQELVDHNFCMPCKYLDERLKELKEYAASGVLYVYQPTEGVKFCDFKPKKVGDVGHDLPVRVFHMKDLVETTVRVSPYREYYINWDEGWVDIPANGYAELPSNICVKVPWDSWGLIKTRSSTGWKRRLHVFEGTIDPGYVGMLCCLIHNPHLEPIRIKDGESLGQLILIPKYPLKEVVYVNNLPETIRGTTGFGSTGA